MLRLFAIIAILTLHPMWAIGFLVISMFTSGFRKLEVRDEYPIESEEEKLEKRRQAIYRKQNHDSD